MAARWEREDDEPGVEHIAEPSPERGRRWWPWLALLGFIVAAGLITWLLRSIFDEGGSAGPESGVTISDIARAPTDYAGRRVTVSGEVAHEFAPNAFAIGSAAVGEFVLVGVPQGVDVDVRNGDVVEVTGVVRVFETDGFEAAYGPLNPGADDVFIPEAGADNAFSRTGVIEASEIAILERTS